jgi:hypothetical protein
MRRLLSILGATLGIIAGAAQTIHPPLHAPAAVHVLASTLPAKHVAPNR